MVDDIEFCISGLPVCLKTKKVILAIKRLSINRHWGSDKLWTLNSSREAIYEIRFADSKRPPLRPLIMRRIMNASKKTDKLARRAIDLSVLGSFKLHDLGYPIPHADGLVPVWYDNS
jgi:hypothetical protein